MKVYHRNKVNVKPCGDKVVWRCITGTSVNVKPCGGDFKSFMTSIMDTELWCRTNLYIFVGHLFLWYTFIQPCLHKALHWHLFLWYTFIQPCLPSVQQKCKALWRQGCMKVYHRNKCQCNPVIHLYTTLSPQGFTFRHGQLWLPDLQI
jgi:hypothetical protein